MTEETKPTKNDNALADEILRTVLQHGDKDEKVKLSDALGALCFAGLEIYFASRFASQSPEQPEGDDKSEKDADQASAQDQD